MSHLASKPFLALVLTWIACTSCASHPPAEQFKADWPGLFLAVSKPFGSRTFYLGSDDHWAYFETKDEDSLFVPNYRKVEPSRVKLTQTFPLWSGKPYRVNVQSFAGYEVPAKPDGA
jgi:hypothetical protein